MAIDFRPVRLDSGAYDDEGMLAYRDGRLIAVLSCLGEIHGDVQGQWFAEATFDGSAAVTAPMFRTLSEAEHWAAAH